VVLVFDPGSKTFLYRNAAFESLCQLSHQEATAHPGALLARIHPDDLSFLSHAYGKLLSEMAAKRIEFRFRSGDSKRTVRLSGFVMESPPARPRRGPSVGLGMSIARTIAEWHGGKIWLESQEQEGATFHIRIPKE
jgi:hypothetical protein